MANYPRQFSETLGSITGRMRALKPNLPPTVCQDFCNDVLRRVIGRQPQWSGLFREAPLYVPAPYDTGSVSFTQNSDHVIGSGTSWFFDDVVNTTIPQGVLRTGYQICYPASMSNITADTTLYVDGEGGDPEVVSVIEVRPTSFVAIFNNFHNAGCSVKVGSHVGRQLRLGNTYPIFSITAVVSATELIIDNPWLATALSDYGYTIQKMYYTISPDIKMLYSVVDQSQGIPPLRINVSVMELNRIDPQRSATGYPQMLANRGPNVNGNMQWEMWPRPQSERQLMQYYFAQPPKLTSEGELLPSFLDPSVVFNGAMADAYRTKVGPDDIYFDPRLAQMYDIKFETGLNDALIADDDLLKTRYANNGGYGNFGGATFWVSHDYDSLVGNF